MCVICLKSAKQFHLERQVSRKKYHYCRKDNSSDKGIRDHDITANSPRGLISIKLLNVTLITGQFAYLVCLDRFEEKGIFQDSKISRVSLEHISAVDLYLACLEQSISTQLEVTMWKAYLALTMDNRVMTMLHPKKLAVPIEGDPKPESTSKIHS